MDKGTDTLFIYHVSIKCYSDPILVSVTAFRRQPATSPVERRRPGVLIDSFTVSLHSFNGRQFCILWKQCHMVMWHWWKGLLVTFASRSSEELPFFTGVRNSTSTSNALQPNQIAGHVDIPIFGLSLAHKRLHQPVQSHAVPQAPLTQGYNEYSIGEYEYEYEYEVMNMNVYSWIHTLSSCYVKYLPLQCTCPTTNAKLNEIQWSLSLTTINNTYFLHTYINSFILSMSRPYIGWYCFSTHEAPLEIYIHLYLNTGMAKNDYVS